MTTAADLVLLDGEIHTLAGSGTDSQPTHEALAVRDGRIVRLGSSYDVEFLAGVDTEVVDLEGRVVLPGFIDAHTHVTTMGRYLVHADLSDAESHAEAIAALERRAAELDDPDAWVLGYGYDESRWSDDRYLDREDLDAVSTERHVAAFREDMHVGSVNSRVLSEFVGRLPEGDVETDADGTPTGVIVEEAIDPIYEAVSPDREGTRELIEAAQRAANELGVTMVHDMVRNSYAPAVYRELDLAGELTMRVRLNYWSDHLDSVIDAGLRTNHGSEFVRVGAIKSFTDGSIGGRTAKLSEPYDDGTGTGQWVVDPEALAAIVESADAAGLQCTVHAIGDVAIDRTLDVYERTSNPDESRHRIEHVELASDEAIERFARLGVVASVQPNFHKWADEGGLYDGRLGDRRTDTNRLGTLHEAGVQLAFGSDCMPLDPLLGVHHAVNAPTDSQRLSVTEAIRAYTAGSAYAGFDEGRLGTIEPGKLADLVVLDRSPWEHPEAIADIDVSMTIVDGSIVHDGRR